MGILGPSDHPESSLLLCGAGADPGGDHRRYSSGRLLDTSDALHSYQPRERKLEILKDSHAGAFAIITAVVYFLFYLGVYSEMTLKALPVVCIGFVLSRAMGGFSIAAFPMAKNTGLPPPFLTEPRRPE